MKGLKIIENELSCLIENAILYEDGTYARINGNSRKGFIVESRKNINNIEADNWSELYPSLEDYNEEYKVIAGETSWGGAGFVALKRIKTDLFKWVLHLSTMNNPIKINIENNTIRLTTDLNYPEGVDFIIPTENPEKFITKKTTANKI